MKKKIRRRRIRKYYFEIKEEKINGVNVTVPFKK